MTSRTHLKNIRERRGISAADLAKRAGVARQTIYAIEGGSFMPNTAVALQLARALDVRVEDIFEIDAENQPEMRAISAHWVDDRAQAADGQLITLCQVGNRMIAAPATVAPAWLPDADGVVEGGRLLSDEEEIGKRVLIAGCDPAVSILARHVEANDGVRLTPVECASRRALDWLKTGKAHIAGAHLRDESTGEFNLPYIRALFPRGGFRVVTFAVWEEGFVVARGNSRHIRTAADLAKRDVRIINREPGAGSRQLLDRLLQEAGVDAAHVRGYETTAGGHLSAALAVAEGRADCCIATRTAARALGLDFIPLASERYELVTLDRFAEQPAVKAVFDTLSRAKLRRDLQVLAGYETAETGKVRN